MGFVRDVAMAGLSPGLALLKGKKKKPEVPKAPSMISTTTSNSPTSLIGAPRRNMY